MPTLDQAIDAFETQVHNIRVDLVSAITRVRLQEEAIKHLTDCLRLCESEYPEEQWVENYPCICHARQALDDLRNHES